MTLVTGGFGLVVRHYENKSRQEGFYFEVSFSPMWNSRLFRRNASRWNGLSEAGIGYKFDSSWHIALKFQHISNGGTSFPNAGVNALALCLGFTF